MDSDEAFRLQARKQNELQWVRNRNRINKESHKYFRLYGLEDQKNHVKKAAWHINQEIHNSNIPSTVQSKDKYSKGAAFQTAAIQINNTNPL